MCSLPSEVGMFWVVMAAFQVIGSRRESRRVDVLHPRSFQDVEAGANLVHGAFSLLRPTGC
jgi:hypothetical protein